MSTLAAETLQPEREAQIFLASGAAILALSLDTAVVQRQRGSPARSFDAQAIGYPVGRSGLVAAVKIPRSPLRRSNDVGAARSCLVPHGR